MSIFAHITEKVKDKSMSTKSLWLATGIGLLLFGCMILVAVFIQH